MCQTNQLPCEDCHTTHQNVNLVLEFLRGKSGSTAVDDYVRALDEVPWNHLSNLRYGHFAMWIWQELTNKLDYVAQCSDSRALENTLRRWYALSRELLSNGPRYPDRDQVIDQSEWVKVFERCVLSADSRVGKSLIKLFCTSFEAPGESALRCACLCAIAPAVLEHHADLRVYFIANAIQASRDSVDVAIQLLPYMVSVIKERPSEFVNYLGEFLQQIPHEYSHVLREQHALIDSWVDQQQNRKSEADLRRGQESIVPYIFGYPKRGRRYSPGSHKIEVTVVPHGGGPQPSVEMRGYVRDISGGPSGLGQGIQVRVPEWSFASLDEPTPTRDGSIRSRRIRATERSGQNSFEFCDVQVVLKYSAGKKLACEKAKSIRGFPKYKEKYNLQGGGLVVYLDDDTPNLEKWREFVTHTLLEVRYEEQIS
jgi:hypothetical protein